MQKHLSICASQRAALSNICTALELELVIETMKRQMDVEYILLPGSHILLGEVVLVLEVSR